MARTSFIKQKDDDVRIVLDQHAKLDLYSASSLKQVYGVDMSLHSDTLSWFQASQSYNSTLLSILQYFFLLQ